MVPLGSLACVFLIRHVYFNTEHLSGKSRGNVFNAAAGNTRTRRDSFSDSGELALPRRTHETHLHLDWCWPQLGSTEEAPIHERFGCGPQPMNR